LYQTIQGRKQVRELDGDSPQSPPSYLAIEAPDPFPTSIDTPLWKLLARVSIICFQTQSAIAQNYSQNGVPLCEAIEQGDLLYAEMLAWKSNLADDMQYQSIAMSPLNEEHDILTNFPVEIFIFKDIQHGAFWTGYWCGVIHLVSMLRRGLNALARSRDDRASVTSRLSNLGADLLRVVDNVCASVPYMMGDIDENGRLGTPATVKAMGSFYLTRGLQIANKVENIPFAQRQWMLGRLFHVGHARGIKIALKSRDLWLEHNKEMSTVT
jgi:hypothetical protein